MRIKVRQVFKQFWIRPLDSKENQCMNNQDFEAMKLSYSHFDWR